MKLLPYILLEKCIYISAVEMARPAKGTSTAPTVSANFRFV